MILDTHTPPVYSQTLLACWTICGVSPLDGTNPERCASCEVRNPPAVDPAGQTIWTGLQSLSRTAGDTLRPVTEGDAGE